MSRRVIVLLGLVMTACSQSGEDHPTPSAGGLGPDFGNAVHHNAAQQIIDPRPPVAGAGAPPLDGHRARLAVERYEGASVLPPERIETTTFGEER